MAIVINTNMASIKIQHDLNSATKRMNTAMERMSSGYKINSAKDDPAGYAVVATMSRTISGVQIAKSNVSMGNDLLSTAEGALEVVKSNLERIRDLTEQAANGTYSDNDKVGIASEIQARLDQIESISQNTDFNGKKLLDGSMSDGLTLQIGSEAGQTLSLSSSIFEEIDLSSLDDLTTTIKTGSSSDISNYLATIDTSLNGIIGRITDVGSASIRLDSVYDTLDVQDTNLQSARSTIRDADIAEESAEYIQASILQEAAAALLVQANNQPQIALQLIIGM